METVDLELLLAASAPGGGSCLSSTTELEPAGGLHTSIAPARFTPQRGDGSVYAFERRYVDGRLRTVAIVDSKQSQLNRAEAALAQAVTDAHPTLSLMPCIAVTYEGIDQPFTDLVLPHRAFDGHIRAANLNGKSVAEVPAYRAMRDATPANARALLEGSPITLVFGGWDSTRAKDQGRWRSALVGEIIGCCPDDKTAMRGGARVDPVAMQINLSPDELVRIVEAQSSELSTKSATKLQGEAVKARAKTKDEAVLSGSALVLGGLPPTLSQLAGIACDRIIRSNVLSFATLRQMRFGAGPQGDAACRALLAALALNGLARADAELYLRANCDLVEAAPPVLTIDQRYGRKLVLSPLTVHAADELLARALENAEEVADVQWTGQTMSLTGEPAIAKGRSDAEPEQD